MANITPRVTNSSNMTSNISDLPHDDGMPVDTRIAAIVVPVIFGFIMISGIIGNGSVIGIVVKNRAMRTVPNIYIVSLAIGDLVLIFVSVPFSAFIYTFDSWYFGEFMCKFNEYMQTLSVGVSVFTLAVMSLDRYKAISEPMETHTERTIAKTLARVFAVWVISAVLAIPDAVMTTLDTDNITDHVTDSMNRTEHIHIPGMADHANMTYHQDITNPTDIKYHVVYFCDQLPFEPWWYRKTQVVSRFLLYFLGPITVIAVCYSLMARILSKSNTAGLMRDEKVRLERSNERMKVARLVLSFVAVFIICWFPRHIFMMWHHIGDHEFNMFWYIFKILGFCLSFINSCVNPIALYLQSQLFRKCFKRQFGCGDTSTQGQYLHMRQFNGTTKPTGTTSVSQM